MACHLTHHQHMPQTQRCVHYSLAPPRHLDRQVLDASQATQAPQQRAAHHAPPPVPRPHLDAQLSLLQVDGVVDGVGPACVAQQQQQQISQPVVTLRAQGWAAAACCQLGVDRSGVLSGGHAFQASDTAKGLCTKY
jgi:hypothetical protein